jgi:hypothetical protein
VFHTNDIKLRTIKSLNNNHIISQFKSSTQIIHKILKLNEQNDVFILNELVNNIILIFDVHSPLAGPMIFCIDDSFCVITIEFHLDS